jgi:hypothetical protein
MVRTSSLAKLKYHMEFFVINLYKVYCNDPLRVIAYSRDKNEYSDKRSSDVKKFGLSFRYSVERCRVGPRQSFEIMMKV